MDEVDGALYKVSGRIIKSEEGTNPANIPLLRPKTLSENTPNDQEYPDAPNPWGVSSQDDESLLSSSDLSDDDKHIKKQYKKKIQQYKRPLKFKSRDNQLYVNGKTRVCQIRTFTYYYEDKKLKQHYIIRIEGSTDITGDTGLRPHDEIISVNGIQLEGMKQKVIIKRMSKIKPGPSGLIHLKLEIRRWKDENNSSVGSTWQDKNTGPVRSTIATICLDLQLQPEGGRGESTVRSKEEAKENDQALPKGNVINIKLEPPGKACIKVLASEGLYLLASNNGNISVGLLDKTDSGNERIAEFYITPFQGYDNSAMPDVRWVFGYIIHLVVNGVIMYMTSCFSNGNNRLVFRHLGDIDENFKNSPDERFFLVHKDGDKTILESMLYRDKCVHFDAASNTLNLQTLNMKQIGGMSDDTCGEFLLDIFRIDITFFNQLIRKVNESMSCLLPLRTTDQ
ncbi:hypothetical protein CHS0354_036885 [Potamilus streckersoni]|uniref:PDZ domain-containing protein n=1 Tax=Potamilus streckersoni TaxID=2493646 RepID=A0AAE0W5T1_9BIVA|nr:hypothetical protein CHS0354_036885 [Potamilus streckersoni]